MLELERSGREMIRSLPLSGEEIVLTDLGHPVAKIVPIVPTRTALSNEVRAAGVLTDEAILASIRDVREREELGQ